jgi:glycosyltransferase involved in cell wall biosynthesis
MEVIAIDDGSSDSTADRAERYAADDRRISVIRQSNEGVSAARNAGLQMARGEFVCFVDADDWIDPDFLTNHINAARTMNADLVVSTKLGSTTSDSVKRWTSSHAAAELLIADIPIGCWNKLYRRQFLVQSGMRFRRDLYMGEGLYFITICAREASVVAAIGGAGYHYRRDNPLSATSVLSVEKMFNALYSISQIEEAWRDCDYEVSCALSYQKMWTLFAGLVNSMVLGEVKSQREFVDGIRSIDLWIPMRIRGNVMRRVKAAAFRVAPVTFARIASHRWRYSLRSRV